MKTINSALHELFGNIFCNGCALNFQVGNIDFIRMSSQFIFLNYKFINNE